MKVENPQDFGISENSKLALRIWPSKLSPGSFARIQGNHANGFCVDKDGAYYKYIRPIGGKENAESCEKKCNQIKTDEFSIAGMEFSETLGECRCLFKNVPSQASCLLQDTPDVTSGDSVTIRLAYSGHPTDSVLSSTFSGNCVAVDDSGELHLDEQCATDGGSLHQKFTYTPDKRLVVQGGNKSGWCLHAADQGDSSIAVLQCPVGWSNVSICISLQPQNLISPCHSLANPGVGLLSNLPMETTGNA